MQPSEAVASGEGNKLSERSEFLFPPQATVKTREAEGLVLRADFLLHTFLCPPKKSMSLAHHPTLTPFKKIVRIFAKASSIENPAFFKTSGCITVFIAPR